MMLRNAALSAMFTLLATGCYSPEFGDTGGFTCKKDKTCPEGYTCSADSLCVKDGQLNPDMGPVADQTTSPDTEPPPPEPWSCTAVDGHQMGQDVISDTLGLTLNATTGLPFLAFHQDLAGLDALQLKIFTYNPDMGWDFVDGRSAVKGTHATLLAAGAQTVVAYNGTLFGWEGLAYASNEMQLPAILTEGQQLALAGHFPTLTPVGNERVLVTHMFQAEEMPGSGPQIESYLITKGVGSPQWLDLPLPSLASSGHSARSTFSAELGLLAFWARHHDGGEAELLLARVVLGQQNVAWTTGESVAGTRGSFDQDALMGLGLAHTSQGFVIAYPLSSENETGIRLSLEGTMGAHVAPGGTPLAQVGNPALASPLENDALGLLFVDEGRRVHFTFRPDPSAPWMTAFELTQPLRDGGRPELIALPGDPPPVGGPPIPMPMKFLAAYPQSGGEVAITRIECVPTLAEGP